MSTVKQLGGPSYEVPPIFVKDERLFNVFAVVFVEFY